MPNPPVFNRFWARWPDEEAGPFLLWTTIAMIDGRPEVVGVEMFSVDPVSIPQLYSQLSEDESRAHFRQVRRATDATDDEKPRALPDDHAIRSKDLRLPLGKIVERYLAPERELAQSYLKGEWFTDDNSAVAVRRAAESIVATPATPAKKAGRKAKPRGEFEEVARIYVEARRCGANPIETIVAEKSVSKSCAAKWIYKCRRPPLNLLPPTRRGVAASIAELDKATTKPKGRK